MGKWVVTSAWPYINTVPHLGNMIGSILSADVFARYLRLRGHDVVFVSGSDEHGTVIEVEARKKGITPKELTDKAHEYVSELFNQWEISFDNYTRTETAIHKDFVRSLMKKLFDRGYIEPKDQVVPYCLRDNIYLPDRFIEGICPYCGYDGARGDQCDKCGRLLDPEDLISPQCVFCGTRPVFVTRKHWFFRIDKLENDIRAWVEAHPNLEDNVKRTTLSWVKSGLKPRAITRDNKWGIPAPFPDAEDKTIYVWFDALLGYVSATIEYFKKQGEGNKWKEFWFDPNTGTSYFIGKDNIPFHSVILPAMLLATGEGYNLPTIISATEYLMYEGMKFSKSRRVGIWIDEALIIVDNVDYWRYALIRMRPEGRDTNFRWLEFIRFVNSELNDDIGNFIHRVLTLIKKYFNGKIPKPSQFNGKDKEFREFIEVSFRKYLEFMDKSKIKDATGVIVKLASRGNKYLNEKAPWAKIKEDRSDAEVTLYLGFLCSLTIAIMLYPIVPHSIEKYLNITGIKLNAINDFNDVEKLAETASLVQDPKPIFRKLDKDFVDKVLKPETLNEIINQAREKAQAERPEVLRW